MKLNGSLSRTATRRLAGAAVLAFTALAGARWWRGFEWSSGQRMRYAWALRARLAGRYAWGRPASEQPPVTVAELDADVASAARNLSAFERAVIGYRVRRQAARA